MIELKNKATLHDLTDFAIAKAVRSDFPRILRIYEKLLPALKNYQQYVGVSSVVQAVEEAQMLMKMQLNQFEKIYDDKGKIDGE